MTGLMKRSERNTLTKKLHARQNSDLTQHFPRHIAMAQNDLHLIMGRLFRAFTANDLQELQKLRGEFKALYRSGKEHGAYFPSDVAAENALTMNAIRITISNINNAIRRAQDHSAAKKN